MNIYIYTYAVSYTYKYVSVYYIFIYMYITNMCFLKKYIPICIFLLPICMLVITTGAHFLFPEPNWGSLLCLSPSWTSRGLGLGLGSSDFQSQGATWMSMEVSNYIVSKLVYSLLKGLITYLYRGYNPVTKYNGHPSTVFVGNKICGKQNPTNSRKSTKSIEILFFFVGCCCV